MKVTIQVIVQSDDDVAIVKEVSSIIRQETVAANLGLTLEESKNITSGIQKVLVDCQTKELVSAARHCDLCGKFRTLKGYSTITYRTLFGKLKIKNPRLNNCSCKEHNTKTFSPLSLALPERIAPELAYLETKWAALMSYGMTVKLIEDVLPISVETSSVRNNVHKVAQRIEDELGVEKHCYANGCKAEWGNLPKPGKPLTVGLDSGYVHAREKDDRKAGWFEVVVGKSMQEDTECKRFGYVSDYDKKPKRRLYEMLSNQGLQMNQEITFLSDGAENLRNLQEFISPQSKHILDWFHITMRITVLQNMLKSLSIVEQETIKPLIEKIKWHIWHGNMFKALGYSESIFDEENLSDNDTEKVRKFWKYMHEFDTYITNNQHLIVNYSDRYHYGESVSSAFVESTVNELISRRMAKKQQMRWSKRGAHLLLQARVKTLNHELKDYFSKWYPDKQHAYDHALPMAA